MGTAYEAQDALGAYKTGTDGGVSPLGGVASNVEAVSLEWDFDPVSTIPPIHILYISGACGPGTATLRADSTSTLRFTAPGSTEGSAISIAAGETKTIVDGGDPAKYVRVYREGTDDLGGYYTLYLVRPYNNIYAGPLLQNSGGAYSGVILRNRSASNAISNLKFWLSELGTAQVSDGGVLGGSGSGTITTTGSFSTWPDVGAVYIETSGGSRREIAWYSSRTSTVLTIASADRGILGTSAAAGDVSDTVRCISPMRFALETPDGTGKIQAIADRYTAPTGVTWYTPINEATALTLSSLPAGDVYGLWCHVQYGSNGKSASVQYKFARKHTIDAVTYTDYGYGVTRIGGTALFALFSGTNAAPDFTASPATTSSSSPFTYALAAPPSGVREYRLAVRRIGAYGVEGANQDTTSIFIDSTGAEVTYPVSAPRNVTLVDRASGVANVQAVYSRGVDTTDADTWRIYYRTNGTDPDPAIDTPITQTMRQTWWYPGAYVLDYDFAALAYGTDLRVIVRAYRSGDTEESANSTVTTLSIGTAGPLQPVKNQATLGAAWGVVQPVADFDSTVLIPGTSSDAYLRRLPGESQFWAGGLNIWRCVYDSINSTGNMLYIPSGLNVISDTVSGSGASTWYEVVSWTGGDKRIAICVSSQRVAMIDVSNTSITWAGRTATDSLTAHPNPPDGVWQHADGSGVTFHVLDATTFTWKAFLKITSAGQALYVPNFNRLRS